MNKATVITVVLTVAATLILNDRLRALPLLSSLPKL
jgi:hypothetical protein